MPFNLDTLELDDTAEPFEFLFGGETFTLPAHYDPRVFRLIGEGDLSGGLLKMLGREQFDRLDAIDQPFDERHFQAMFEAWAKHVGTTVGEASASSSSSKSTGRLSKPTSNGSTQPSSRASSPDVSSD